MSMYNSFYNSFNDMVTKDYQNNIDVLRDLDNERYKFELMRRGLMPESFLYKLETGQFNK